MQKANEQGKWNDPRLTALALGEELSPEDRAAVEALLAEDAGAQAELEALRVFGAELEHALGSEGVDTTHALSDDQRNALRERAPVPPTKSSGSGQPLAGPGFVRARRWVAAAGVLVLAGGAVALMLHKYGSSDEGALMATFSYETFGTPASSPAVSSRTSPPATAATPARRADRQTLDSLRALGYGGGAPVQRLGYVDEGQVQFETPGNTESYDPVRESRFTRTDVDPRATFSVDVDTASYANVRRFIRSGQLPPPDAVRIEELLNYFPWDDAGPDGSGDGSVFAVTHQVTSAPWNPAHRLVRIGVQAREVAFEERESANLVFLLDVSGSMNSANKLPLLQSSLAMLVEQLRSDDRIAIVAYAGSSGLVLPSTACANAPAILEALERLSAGGSTNGGAGIELAYRVARDHFVPGGINRVVLATDGDFNVGITDRGSLVRMIEREAESGVQLTALGFGMGNLKDDTLELLTNKGDGNYAYVDSLREAHKVLVEELGGTLVTVARDTKLQVEWNPAAVGAWRLIGYENRRLQHQDFEDDTVDAAEVGSGHHVTVLFELVPPGQLKQLSEAPPLRYQQGAESREPTGTAFGGELGFFKLRHLQPNSDAVGRVELPLFDEGLELEDAHPDLAFAAAVAGYGLLLSRSEHAGELTFEDVFRLAQLGQGADPGGYRADFVLLALEAQLLARQAGWEEPEERRLKRR